MNSLPLIANLVFVLVGVATTMLGPLLPLYAARFALGDRQSGILFLAQFFGGFAGSILSTELTRRIGLRHTIRLGLMVIGAGALATAAPSLTMVVAAIGVYGVGIGFCSPTITAAVTGEAGARSSSALNVLNFSWSIGAILAPALLVKLASTPRAGFGGAMLLLCAAFALAAVVFPQTCDARATQAEPAARISASLLRLIVATGVMIFLYVGIENGVAGWLPTLSSRLHQFTANDMAWLQGTFWTALLAGRLLAPLALERSSEPPVLRASIALATLGTLGILCARGSAMLFAAVFVTGLGLAPVFPTTIGYLSRHLGAQAGTRLGWMFAAAGLGGAAVPYCVGMVSSATQRLLAGFSVVLAAECALFAGFLITRAQARHVEREA